MISMIVARSANGVIGINNALPWRLVGELKYFKKMTEGYPIVMGRKTFQSFGSKPLPNRTNVIMTTRELDLPGTEHKDVLVATDEVMSSILDTDFFVIGGEQIYQQFMKLADRLIITEVSLNIQNGDAHFPEFSMDDWKVDSSEDAVYYDQMRHENVMCSHVVYIRK